MHCSVKACIILLWAEDSLLYSKAIHFLHRPRQEVMELTDFEILSIVLQVLLLLVTVVTAVISLIALVFESTKKDYRSSQDK